MSKQTEFIEAAGWKLQKKETGSNEFKTWMSYYYTHGDYRLYYEELESSVNGMPKNNTDGLIIIRKGDHVYTEGRFKFCKCSITERGK